MAMDIPLEPSADIDLKTSFVADEELLYRSIPYTKLKDYIQQTNGGFAISSQAFSDRGLKPSVDRAVLNNNAPSKTQVNPRDGVVSLLTSKIRKIDEVKKQSQDAENITIYKIDVVHRPTSTNFAHAQIEPSPEYETKNIFKKLTHSLAFLATQRIREHGWEIDPYKDL
jgi:hypothetical protein